MELRSGPGDVLISFARLFEQNRRSRQSESASSRVGHQGYCVQEWRRFKLPRCHCQSSRTGHLNRSGSSQSLRPANHGLWPPGFRLRHAMGIRGWPARRPGRSFATRRYVSPSHRGQKAVYITQGTMLATTIRVITSTWSPSRVTQPSAMLD